jgi:ribosome-binding protein aMBF1 (putative translation factor)
LDYPDRMITAEQTRAGRAWLNWNQADLAAKAEIGLSTLRAFEAGQRAPIRANLAAIQRTLESAGVRLLFAEDGKATGIAIDDARLDQISGASGAGAGNEP